MLDTKYNSHKTAIKRSLLSAPLSELTIDPKIKKSDRLLDYGCGRGMDVVELRHQRYNIVGYDPYQDGWRDESVLKEKHYDIIFCTYVLNVVDASTRKDIIGKVRRLLKPGGKAYFTVRRDLKENYRVTKIGTHQWQVYLPWTVRKQTSSYCIYEISNK